MAERWQRDGREMAEMAERWERDGRRDGRDGREMGEMGRWQSEMVVTLLTIFQGGRLDNRLGQEVLGRRRRAHPSRVRRDLQYEVCLCCNQGTYVSTLVTQLVSKQATSQLLVS